MAIDPSSPRSGAARILRSSGLLGAVLGVLLLPCVSQAATPLGLYPVQGSASEQSRTSVRDLIAAGLQMAGHQHVFTARKPLVVPARCAPKVTVHCLAGLADQGAIVYAIARDNQAAVEVTLVLVTADGKRTKPIEFENNAFFQDDRLAVRVVEALESAYLELGVTPPAVAAAPATVTAPPTAAPPPTAPSTTTAPSTATATVAASSTAAPASAPPSTAAPAPAQVAKADLAPQPESPASSVESDMAIKPPSSGWMTKAAIGCGAGGALVLGGGVVFGLLAKNLNQDLTDRYHAGTLVASDSAKYSRLKTYDGLATAMLIGGGALTAAGLTFWAISPSVGVTSQGSSISIEGSF